MFKLLLLKLERDIILKNTKISSQENSYTPPLFGAVSKKCWFVQLSKNLNSEEITTYGEIQQDYHEGCPPTFAPPN